MSVDPISNDTNSKVEKTISVVPWYNTAQFKKVYEYLFSTELVKKRWAVDQISVWETRCYPSLPTGIEATLVIVRAIIQDILLTNEASLCQERDIQMMYSMALVRFVNLSIECHRNTEDLVTAAQTAKGLGIPSWIVDLRNEAAHSFSPSLPSLRMAAEAALKFLKKSFWEKEISAVKNLEKEPFDEKDIRDLICNYIAIHFNIRKCRRKTDQSEQFCKHVDESKNVLDKLAARVQKNKRQFINILISDGLFIPYDDELKNIMTPSECLKYEEAFDEAYDKQSMPPAGLSVPPVPAELQHLWKEVLKMLNNFQAVPLLLEALLKSQAGRSEMGKKLVIAWAKEIIDCEGNLMSIFKRQGLMLNWHSLFNAALSQPCIYTPYIFCRVYRHLNLKKNAAEYIMSLLSIAIGFGGWDSVKLPNNYPVHTVDDLKQMKKLQTAKKEKSKEENIWSVVEDPCYKSWPIGFVSHPVDDFDKAEDQPDDFIPLEYFEEKMDFTEKYFIYNKNDNEEEDFVVNQPSISEDEMEISERQTFLYNMK